MPALLESTPAPFNALLQGSGTRFEPGSRVAFETVAYPAQFVFECRNLPTQFLVLAHLGSVWAFQLPQSSRLFVLIPFGLGRLIPSDQAVFAPELV